MNQYLVPVCEIGHCTPGTNSHFRDNSMVWLASVFSWIIFNQSHPESLCCGVWPPLGGAGRPQGPSPFAGSVSRAGCLHAPLSIAQPQLPEPLQSLRFKHVGCVARVSETHSKKTGEPFYSVGNGMDSLASSDVSPSQG